MEPTAGAPAWEIDGSPDRVIAIGDIHGDLDALVRILQGMDLLGPDGGWGGGSTHVVLMGDLNDRGPESVNVMDFVMSLERGATEGGGGLHVLLGNHELLAVQQDYRYIRGSEFLAMERFWFGGVNGLNAIFRRNSPWARWIRGRPTLLKVNEMLFVHAGVDAWALDHPPEFINAGVQAWVSGFQGVSDEPDESTAWLVEEAGEGPLWTHRFRVQPALDAGGGFGEVLDEILRVHGASTLVVGHCPTWELGYEMACPHPAYGDRVALIDTGISRHFMGRLSALEINQGRMKPHYFERGAGDSDLTCRVRAQCVARREALADKDE